LVAGIVYAPHPPERQWIAFDFEILFVRRHGHRSFEITMGRETATCLVNHRAFVLDLEPIVNVAHGPTRFKHDPSRGSRRVDRVALRYFHPVDKDKKVLAVILKFADRFVFAHGSTPLIHNILGSGGPDTRRRWCYPVSCTAKKRGTMAKKLKIDTNKEIKVKRKQIVDLGAVRKQVSQ
jgi:hypothetical protein